ncbi:transposase, partial [Mammaliicoccus vitulinus]
MRKKYDFNFKLKLVKEYLDGQSGYKALTLKHDISSSSVIQIWVN